MPMCAPLTPNIAATVSRTRTLTPHRTAPRHPKAERLLSRLLRLRIAVVCRRFRSAARGSVCLRIPRCPALVSVCWVERGDLWAQCGARVVWAECGAHVNGASRCLRTCCPAADPPLTALASSLHHTHTPGQQMNPFATISLAHALCPLLLSLCLCVRSRGRRGRLIHTFIEQTALRTSGSAHAPARALAPVQPRARAWTAPARGCCWLRAS